MHSLISSVATLSVTYVFSTRPLTMNFQLTVLVTLGMPILVCGTGLRDVGHESSSKLLCNEPGICLGNVLLEKEAESIAGCQVRS